MKRSLIALCLLVVFAVACASTTATAPQLRGVVTEKEGNVITVTPADGTATVVNVNRSTRVFWQNGEEAGRSVLMKGHPVQVWLKDGTKDASKVVIAP